jgi:hypothetical protein
MRPLLVIAGILLAALGGAVAYRAAFVAPRAAVIISESSGRVREVSNIWHVAGGVLLLLAGSAVAFLAARRRP